MLDNVENKNLDNYYIDKRNDARKKLRFKKNKRNTFFLGIFISFIILIMYYFISSSTNTYDYAISGNVYLKNESIIKYSNLNYDMKYDLIVTSSHEKKLSRLNLFEKVSINKIGSKIITINVNEKKILAHLIDSNGNVRLVLNDSTLVNLDKDLYYLIKYCPLLIGYDETNYDKLVYSLNKLDKDSISLISEIRNYPISYDDSVIEILMKDTRYIYGSFRALYILNNYHDILSSVEMSNETCLFIDELTNSGYTTECKNIQDEHVVEENSTEDIQE